MSVDISQCQFGPLISAPNDIIALDGDELVGFTLRGAITYVASSISRPGHYVTHGYDTREKTQFGPTVQQERNAVLSRLSPLTFKLPVLLYQRTNR